MQACSDVFELEFDDLTDSYWWFNCWWEIDGTYKTCYSKGMCRYLLFTYCMFQSGWERVL